MFLLQNLLNTQDFIWVMKTFILSGNSRLDRNVLLSVAEPETTQKMETCFLSFVWQFLFFWNDDINEARNDQKNPEKSGQFLEHLHAVYFFFLPDI